MPSPRALKKAKALYLATDPDREGEAIAWHLYEILKERARARRQEGASRGLLRDHAQRDPRGGGAAARAVVRSGECAAGAPRARLSGRLQSLAAAVEESAARPVRRPRAEPRAAHDLRARGRDRGVHPAGILDARCAKASHSQQTLPAQAHRVSRARRSSSSASSTRRRRAKSSAPSRPPRAPRARRRWHRHAARLADRSQAAPPQSGAAVHHFHAAAGSRAQARLQRAPHHAPRAAAL